MKSFHAIRIAARAPLHFSARCCSLLYLSASLFSFGAARANAEVRGAAATVARSRGARHRADR